jgi:GWxTD domain-containing protein
MKIKLALILLALVFSAAAKEFFYVDYSCFKTADPALTRTDIYIAIPVTYLEFGKDMASEFAIKIYVYDKDKLVAEDKWKQKYSISREEEKYSGAEIPVLSKMTLPPGYYKLVVEVEDLRSGKKIDTLEVPQESKMFMVAGFDERFSMSTIQLASRIITDKADEKSEFYKQGVVILPNPSKIYGTNRPFVFYYAELYGIEAGDEIEYQWKISTPEGSEAKIGEKETKKSVGKTMVLADRITVPGLRTGEYEIFLTVSNKRTGKSIEGRNNLYIYRKIDFTKDKYRLPADISVSARDSIELEIMKDDEIELEFAQVLSTLQSSEQSKYSSLLISGKREYLKEYWTQKEKMQKDARNNFKSLVKKIANEFSNKKTEGWKTDRGRTYLKMGPPNKRDIETYNNEFQDHEVWHYFEGNYTFIFSDAHGLGDFKLIHSDFPGEKNDPNWQNKIKKSRFGE